MSTGSEQRPPAGTSGVTRRRFLLASGVTGAAALAAGATGLNLLQRDHVLAAAARRSPLAPGTGILVLVTLYGGNDGLNTVVPAGDPAYQAARAMLGYQPHEVLPLSDGLGLNPTMTQLKKRWDGGQLAVLRGVGYPAPDHSHFRSMAIWQTGSPGTSVRTGWLGRWLDATGTDPLRAIAVGPTLPPLLAGDRASGACVPTGPFRLPAGELGAAFRALEGTRYDGAPALTQALAQSGADLLTVAARLGPALGQSTRAEGGAPTLDNGGPTKALGGELAAQLDVVARCIAAGVPTRVYSVSLGGFDTHAGEKGTQSRLLGELDAALGSFLEVVGGSPRGRGVVVAAYSEFGRRVQVNGSAGTDHGTAGPVLVVGPGVRGGMYGDQPSLTDLDNGDLRAALDFRDVYATLLQNVLGTEASVVFPGEKRQVLSFV